MLSPNRLVVLREVVATGSFSAAADELAYSQSAVSQAIAALEAEVGAQLIERRRGGVRPTPAGAALIAHIGGILARMETAEAEVEAISAGRGGRLRTASFPTAGATLMPEAIARFRASHPGVDVSLEEGEPEEIGPRLRAGEFDLVLLFEFEGVGERLGAGMRRFELLEDPLHLALPGDHALAGRRRLRLEDLRGESWVQTSEASPCARHVVRSCHAAGFEPRVSFESDDYQTVQGLVAAGVGVALIPELALSTVREDIDVRELSPQSPVRLVFAATPRGAAVTPAVATMLDILRERRGAEGRPRAGRTAPGGGGGSVLLAVTAPGAGAAGRGGAAGHAVRVPERRHVGRVHLVAVDGDVAVSISSSVIRSGTTRPTSLSRMKVPIAEKTITQSAVSACQPSRCRPPPEIVPARTVSAIALLAKMPTSRPPASPAKPCV